MVSKNKTWQDFLEAEAQKPYFQELMKKVEVARATAEVFPSREGMFSCFEKCPLDKIKVVIIGQDPYHGAGQAHGMAFSVKKGVKIPPSLRNIFKELSADLGVETPSHGFLENWAEQGVLLLNSTLTVRAGEAGSHARLGWADFTTRVLDFLNQSQNPLVFILWGNHAQKLGERISNEKHLKITSAHPSPLSANRGFFGSKPFSRANDFLRENKIKEIDWKIPN